MPVRASLGQLFVRNWPIKLAALFFAIMLYVAVAAQQPLTQSFALRLAIGIPPGRTVRQQPAGVTVVIAGTGSEILKLRDRKSTRLNSSHGYISYAVFCLKKKKYNEHNV